MYTSSRVETTTSGKVLNNIGNMVAAASGGKRTSISLSLECSTIEKSEKNEKGERSERGDKSERSERMEKSDRGDRNKGSKSRHKYSDRKTDRFSVSIPSISALMADMSLEKNDLNSSNSSTTNPNVTPSVAVNPGTTSPTIATPLTGTNADGATLSPAINSNVINPNDKQGEKGVRKNADQRIDVLREIITTERNYVYDLSILVCLYLKPLQVDDSILPKENINTIFMNIEVLYRLSNEFLCKLESVFPNLDNIEPDTALLGPILLQIGHFLKLYSTYCSNYKASIEHCILSCKSYPAFAQFLKDTQSNPECKGLSLSDYLIKPVQRLCKYPLLFRELSKVTPSDHPDYPSVVSTQALFQNVTEMANKISAQKENFEKMMTFCTTVEGIQDDKFFQSGRAAIRDDWFQTIANTQQKSASVSHQSLHLYLFSDILVFTKKIRGRVSKNGGGGGGGTQKGTGGGVTGGSKGEGVTKSHKTERVKVVLFLKNVEMREQPSEGQLAIQLTDLNVVEDQLAQVYTILFPNGAVKIQWIEDIKKCTAALEKENQTCDKENGFKPKKTTKKMKPEILRQATRLRESSNAALKETKEKENFKQDLPPITSAISTDNTTGSKHRKLRRAETTRESPSKSFKADLESFGKKRSNFALRTRKSSSDLGSMMEGQKESVSVASEKTKDKCSEIKEKLLEKKDKLHHPARKALVSSATLSQRQLLSSSTPSSVVEHSMHVSYSSSSIPSLSEPTHPPLPASYSTSSLPYLPSQTEASTVSNSGQVKELTVLRNNDAYSSIGVICLRRRRKFHTLNDILADCETASTETQVEDSTDSEAQWICATGEGHSSVIFSDKDRKDALIISEEDHPSSTGDVLEETFNESPEEDDRDEREAFFSEEKSVTDKPLGPLNVKELFPANVMKVPTKSCYHCGVEIPKNLAAIETFNRSYHSSCFVCYFCKTSLIVVPFFHNEQHNQLVCGDCYL